MGADAVLERWPAALRLAAGEVHVWWRRDAESAELPLGEDWLSDDERARAERFRFEHLQASFRRRQGFLRGVLGRYLGRAPAGIEFVAGERGKPLLALEGEHALGFNLSHSKEWILVAVARGLDVGVDVQARLPLKELDAMALQIMTPAEHARFLPETAEARFRLFYRLWARKEAVLKASGLGLYREPSSLHVGFEELAQGQLTGPPAGESWDGVLGLTDLPAPTGYDAALAACGRGWRARHVVPPEA